MAFPYEPSTKCRVLMVALLLVTLGSLASLQLQQHSSRDVGSSSSPLVGRMQRISDIYKQSSGGGIKTMGIEGSDDKQHQIIASGNTNSSEAGKRKRPRLILHVGPSKSATTSLQTDLTAVQKELEEDGYLYAGRYYSPYTNKKGVYFVNRSESALLTEAHNMLKDCDLEPRVECCRNFLKALNAYTKGKPQRNIILSEEPFGNSWKHPEDWQAIRDAVSHEWDVTVVVGYRRLYAWLPSARYQHERTDRNLPRKNPWPNTANGGELAHAIDPFFPVWWNHWHVFFMYTGNILDALGDTFPVQIINLHNKEKLSPLTTLLCEILEGETDAACQHSLEKDHASTKMNTHASAPSLFYDGIATGAAARDLINLTAWTRSVLRDAIRTFQEEELQLTPQDLKLDCPTENLGALWSMSWHMEETYMPEFAQRPGQQADHRAGFDKYVANKAYCWIDIDAIVVQKQWQKFFSRFK